MARCTTRRVRPPLTKSQIERLGVRLVHGTKPTDADVELLHEVLRMYSEVLAGAVERVRDGLGVSPTSRIKNTGTILEKLRRNGGHGLKSIQDLAGMRIVVRSDRRGQDAVVQQLVEVFGEDARPPKVVDRRAAPVRGYRAVHVIAFPDGVPIEIQVRLSIRYGVRTTIVEQALAVADMIDAVENAEAVAPEDPELDAYRRRVDGRLAALRTSLEGL